MSNCLACTRLIPEPFLDLGRTPLANSFLAIDQLEDVEPKFPLAVAFCENCYLVQLIRTVPPADLFTNYLYFSSYSETTLDHARVMAHTLVRDYFPPNGKVLEVGSNDGYLLQYFKDAKASVLGVEPAKNIAEVANKKGITTISDFFNLDNILRITSVYGLFDLIIGNNVLAHVPNIVNFLAAIRYCLNDNGVAVFEFPYLLTLLNNIEFDTIYHEHVFYFSVLALNKLFTKCGLEIFDIQFQEIHGGSLRIFIQQWGGENRRPVNSIVSFYELQERLAGLDSLESYIQFEQEVKKVYTQLGDLLTRLKKDGHRIAAYGAPAKGNTLLNYCKIGTELIDFTVDANPHKQGLYLPGTHIPILDRTKLLSRMPDYTLILPWNITREIRFQQAEYERQGGKFIVPIPIPRII